jgi:hypothetical protein
MAVTCLDLPRAGTGRQLVSLAWNRRAQEEGERVGQTFQELLLTEMAAVGVCAAALAALGEGAITEVTQHGSGVDYWVDDRRATLEVSGVKDGAAEGLDRRHREKIRQLMTSSLFAMGNPGYVFVVLFAQKGARFSYHHP